MRGRERGSRGNVGVNECVGGRGGLSDIIASANRGPTKRGDGVLQSDYQSKVRDVSSCITHRSTYRVGGWVRKGGWVNGKGG